MSVNTKMTAIADKVRSLLGITGKLGLDAMNTNLTTANTEVATQEELMEEILTTLAEKSAGGGTAKEEQEKTIEITENGTTEVTPDSGKVLSKVTVNVEVESGGGSSQGIIFNEVGEDGYPLKVTIPSNILQTHHMFYMKGKNYGLWGKLTEIDYNHCSANIGEQFAEYCGSLVNIKNVENVKTIIVSSFRNTNLDNFPFGEGLEKIENQCFRYTKLSKITLPSTLDYIGEASFGNITTLTEVTFKGKPTTLNAYTFVTCNALANIYVPWSEGEVVGAPWGATNATIHYNTTV